ncbi:alpha/beta hydrolase [Mailhella sp.]
MAEIFECGTMRTRDGLNLYFRLNRPRRPKALVIFLHSLGEHSGRYEDMTEKLNEAGYGVCRFDCRGHGRSDGPRGDVQDFQDYLRDVDTVVELVRKTFPGLALFLMGHSMGGLVAAAYAAEFPGKVDGGITAGAAVRMMPALEFLKRDARHYHRERGDERFSFLIPRQKTRTADKGEDSLVLDSATVRLAGRVWIEGADWFASHRKDITSPLFILHGESDGLVPPESSKWLYDGVASEDRALRLYPERGHSLLEGDAEVMSDIVAWLDAHRREGASGDVRA